MRPPRPWRRLGSERLQDCRVFEIERVRFERPEGGEEHFYCIEAPDWINVIPVTADRRVLLIRQFRFGLNDFTLEIPGGMCDPGESPEDAAVRELREETGHAAARMETLGWVHPNPALQGNRCHTYLAHDVVEVGEQQPDEHEEIEILHAPLDEIPALIREGRITHSLVVAAFRLLDR